MKSKQTNELGGKEGARGGFSALCLRSCRKILAHIQKAREAIFAESRSAVESHESMLQLALNEAEALAWQTGYPHLVFPALAMEKARAVADWSQHQRSIRHVDPRFALAA
jgi:hypothetical protein